MKTKLFGLLSCVLLIIAGLGTWLNSFKWQRVLSIDDVRQLCALRKESRPVLFRGVVTLVQGSSLFAQDDSGGIRIRLADRPQTKLTGHLVEISGVTPVGPGENSVSSATYKDLGLTKLPAPHVTSEGDLQSSRLDATLVTLRGVACPGHVDGAYKLSFHVRTGSVVSEAQLTYGASGADRFKFLNAEAEFTGVASAVFDATDRVTRLTLLVASPSAVKITKSPQDFAALPVTRLATAAKSASEPSDKAIRLRGRLVESPNRLQLLIRDTDGSQLELRIVDGLCNPGATVDVVGYLTRVGTTTILDDAVVIAPKENIPVVPEILRVSDLRMISPAEARLRRPVQLEGVITFLDREGRLAFIQDKTAGICTWWRESMGELKQGDWVRATGVTDPGDFVPTLEMTHVEVLKPNAPLPVALPAAEDDLFAGQADGQWVELDGTVQDSFDWNGRPALWVEHHGRHFLIVFVPSDPSAESWVNTKVRVRGVCGALFNSRRQLVGLKVFAQNTGQLTLLERAPYAAFNGPITPIGSLLTFSPANRAFQLRLHGSVLASQRQGPTWVQDATGGLLIKEHGDVVLKPGDEVEVAGFSTWTSEGAQFESAKLRRLGPGSPPVPSPMDIDDAIAGGENARLVSVDAQVVDQFRSGEESDLLAQVGHHTFTVRSPVGLPAAKIGTLVHFVGICIWRPARPNTAQTFELLVRSAADLTVLRPAPWLTKEYAFRAIGLLALLGLGAAVWVALLRRRVSQQTRFISQKMEELRAMKERAESGSRAKSEFLANVSHEIRTPMNGIVGMTELVLEQQLEPAVRDSLRMVKSSADSLLTIVDNVLDFSKVEAGKLELDPVRFCLADCVEEVVWMLTPRALSKDLELICDLDANLPAVVVADQARLRQVLTNLLANAVKFTERGDVELRAFCESSGPGLNSSVHFVVRDTGIGIPAEKQSVIFAAFTQADASMTRRYGGSGLGLAIVSQLVTLLRGRVWLESEVGKGSQFHFTVPLEVAPESEAEPHPCLHALKGKRVLVIDANRSSASALERMLLSWGAAVVRAETPAEAMDQAGRRAATTARFDLVTCDVRMGGLNEDGTPKMDWLGDCPAFTDSQVLLVGGQAALDWEPQWRYPKFAGYLAKPLLRMRLYTALAGGAGVDGELAANKNRVPLPSEPHLARSTRPLRALVVEDNQINQLVARRLIERSGGEVILAADGHQALRALDENDFDLVLMDIQMPGLDGLETTREVRRREQGSGRHQYIVALTAHAMAADHERCLAAGMDDYLAKPIRWQDLHRILDKAIGKGAARLSASAGL